MYCTVCPIDQPAAGTIDDSDDELVSTRRPRSSTRSLRRKRAVVYTQLCAVTDARKTAGKRSKATFSIPFDGSGSSRVEQLAFFGCELVEDLKLEATACRRSENQRLFLSCFVFLELALAHSDSDSTTRRGPNERGSEHLSDRGTTCGDACC